MCRPGSGRVEGSLQRLPEALVAVFELDAYPLLGGTDPVEGRAAAARADPGSDASHLLRATLAARLWTRAAEFRSIGAVAGSRLSRSCTLQTAGRPGLALEAPQRGAPRSGALDRDLAMRSQRSAPRRCRHGGSNPGRARAGQPVRQVQARRTLRQRERRRSASART